MKKRLLAGLLALTIIAAGSGAVAWLKHQPASPTAEAAEAESFDDLYVCAMHPYEVSDDPGSCEICGMNLSQVHNHKAGDPMPPLSQLFVDADKPLEVYEGNTGNENLIPITESPWYEPREPDKHGAMSDDGQMDMDMDTAADQTSESPSGLWTCGMHPEVIQDHPGLCPICHMELTPLKTSGGPAGTVSIDPVTLQNIGVTTATVKRMDLSRRIRTNGTVEVAEDREFKLNARISGWVEKLHVNKTGSYVRKGDPMLEIYSPELVSTQQEYLLALSSASRFDTAKVEQTRDAGQMLVNAARRRLELWGISDRQISELKRTGKVRRTLTLVAPASGNVLSKNVVEGSSVKSGQDLFTIVDLNSLWVEAQVYEDEAPWVNEGNVVTLTSSYDPELMMTGRVDFVYPTLDPVSRTLELRIVVDNRDLRLRPDMFVNVSLETEPVRDVIAVPNSALIRSGVRTIVFVKTGKGEFTPREVQTGVVAEGQTQIRGNLTAGEAVVTSAQFLLDSEAQLQEAIQRRIAAAGNDTDAMSSGGGGQSGHQH